MSGKRGAGGRAVQLLQEQTAVRSEMQVHVLFSWRWLSPRREKLCIGAAVFALVSHIALVPHMVLAQSRLVCVRARCAAGAADGGACAGH